MSSWLRVHGIFKSHCKHVSYLFTIFLQGQRYRSLFCVGNTQRLTFHTPTFTSAWQLSLWWSLAWVLHRLSRWVGRLFHTRGLASIPRMSSRGRKGFPAEAPCLLWGPLYMHFQLILTGSGEYESDLMFYRSVIHVWSPWSTAQGARRWWMRKSHSKDALVNWVSFPIRHKEASEQKFLQEAIFLE